MMLDDMIIPGRTMDGPRDTYKPIGGLFYATACAADGFRRDGVLGWNVFCREGDFLVNTKCVTWEYAIDMVDRLNTAVEKL